MSVRKDRQLKAEMAPLIEDVQKYVETNQNTIPVIARSSKLKVKAHYDRLKKETQLILTFVERAAGEKKRAVAPTF